MKKNKTDVPEVKAPANYGLNKQEFEKIVSEEFAKSNGKIEGTFLNGMSENEQEEKFYNDLKAMIEDKASGEVLIHNLNMNKEPLILVFPSNYRFNSSTEISEQVFLTAKVLKSFVEKFNDAEVSFGMFDQDDKITKVTLQSLEAYSNKKNSLPLKNENESSSTPTKHQEYDTPSTSFTNSSNKKLDSRISTSERLP
jgi:hypothetical protein